MLLAAAAFSSAVAYRAWHLLTEKDRTILSLQSDIEYLRSEVERLNSTLAKKDEQISSLRKLLAEKDNAIKSLESEVAFLRKLLAEKDSTIDALRSEVRRLWRIIRLEESTVLVSKEVVNQPAGSYTSWTFRVEYAGYIEVIVHSSTTDKTYISVTWSSRDVHYFERIDIGTTGRATFPVLPTSQLIVTAGNRNIWHPATMTISIIYHY